MKASILSIVGCLVISLIALCKASCPYKYQGFDGHTACISKSSLYISGGVTDKEKKEILDAHNKYRGSVQPPACTMLKLYWNDDLAFLAQKWAENCKFEHDKSMHRYIPGSFSVGQNLGSGFSTWTGVIDAWQEEVKDFTYNGTNVLAKVGHYTQVVWSTTGLVGCSFAKCKGVNLHVCDYGPGGNIGSVSVPYKSCTKASPLKDCKGKVCKNGGSFKKDSCDCECKKFGHIYGPECSINCTVKDRPMPCGSAYKADSCKFSNVPSECPWMCKVCPYIDKSGGGGGSSKYSVTYPLVLTVLFLILLI